MKYQLASVHYETKKLEAERDYYKHLAEVFFSTLPASVNAGPVPRDSDSGSGMADNIKYQREMANTWGPILLMKDQVNPPAQNSGSG